MFEGYEIVGIRNVDFKDKQDRLVQGLKLFLSYKDQHIVGIGTESIFVSQDKIGDKKFKLGDKIRIYYNKYGKVDSVCHV